ncbi:hypothetical protein [Kineosporia sp. NBRC 101731]|uniref:hypothetical protein n=1 Tax=Kineosporia sp. NBRC 101731 TaxID=3032199 RepID=UPI0024A35A85|nr:hypothetical protein [Kineosporia sp. NBRC 101731]GLY27044.1 hypothetical protein Kisp02_04090 [Kineosporia sp. NBRC 101731]
MGRQFNSPPGWPTPPDGWVPPRRWQPDPQWPTPPFGWQYFVEDQMEDADHDSGGSGWGPSDADEVAPARVPRGWARSDLDASVGLDVPVDPSRWAERSEWLREVQASGFSDDGYLPEQDLGSLTWAASSYVTSGPSDPSDWLDRFYGFPGQDVPHLDLDPADRSFRRGPAHVADAPGRFREPAMGAHCSPRLPWYTRKALMVPMVVLIGLGGLGLGRGVLEAVNPLDEQVTLADPPLLTGQKGPHGLVSMSDDTRATTKTGEGKLKAGVSATTAPSASRTDQKPGKKTPDKNPTTTATAQKPRANRGDRTPSSGTGLTHRPDWTSSGRGDEDESKPDRTDRECDPNYARACVPIAMDVDCEGSGGDGPAFLSRRARVVGEDIYRLDSNGDGWAC